MTRRQVYIYGGVFLGLTGLGLAYYFLVWNKATEDQFYEFENIATKNNSDIIPDNASRRLALMKMWHKNLTKKQANRLIYLIGKKESQMSAGELLEFSRLTSIWFERPIKSLK